MKLTLKDPIRFTDKWVDTDGRESLSTFQGYSQFSDIHIISLNCFHYARCFWKTKKKAN